MLPQAFLDLRTTGMEFASEMVIKAGKARLDVAEIPITLHKDMTGSSINTVGGMPARCPMQLNAGRGDGWRPIGWNRAGQNMTRSK